MDQPTFHIVFYFTLSVTFATSVALWFKRQLGPRKPSLKCLNGPASPSWLAGNMRVLQEESAGHLDKKYIREYGLAFRLKGPLDQDILYLADPQGLNYILNTAGHSFHTKETAMMFNLLLGPNILGVEGESHDRHRKVMVPGFSQKTLREFVPACIQITEKVVAKWRDILQSNGQQSTTVDAHWWLSGLALDVVGHGILSYDFGSLNDTPGDFATAYNNLSLNMFHKRSDVQFAVFDLFRHVPRWLAGVLHKTTLKAAKRFDEFQAVSKTIAADIIQREIESLEGGRPHGKNVMSSLLHANMNETAKNKMSTEELLAQMSALIIAGHDTTSNTLAWVIYELSRHPEVQHKIREEIKATKAATGNDPLEVNDFESMHYTIAVIKESLRFYPIVPRLKRRAVHDDLIPLARPIKTATGEEIAAVPIQKGQQILASLWGYNRVRELWGEDADEWKPERFLDENLNHRQQKGFGVYANLGTFGGGSHSCIGWRLALLEMQAILITLLQHFEFSPPPRNPVMMQALALIVFPMVKGEEEKGSQLPVSISFVN